LFAVKVKSTAEDPIAGSSPIVLASLGPSFVRAIEECYL
jgi:hypothetical protein